MFNHPPFLNIEIIRTHPRESILFAKEFFKGRKIIACEIGVWYGRNARIMNEQLNIEKLFLIDNYADTIINDFNKEKIESYAHKRNNKGNEVWIRKKSENAIEDIEMLDFLYIDGNHDYEYVKKDLELYWDKIEHGGIIAGHDIQEKGVSRAVIEFANERSLKIRFGERRDWWIIKGEENEE